LADDRPSWRPDSFGYSLWGTSERFEFARVKLLDYTADVAALETSSNPFAALVLAHLKTQETSQDGEARRSWKVRLVKGLYERGLDAHDIRQLFRLIDWMMDLPKPLEALFLQEIYEFEGDKHMPYVTSAERFGREAGFEDGLREGLLRGIELGLRLRFGSDGLRLSPEIRQIADVAVLQAIQDAIETVATLDELHRVWS
jgi:hypothetical protein